MGILPQQVLQCQSGTGDALLRDMSDVHAQESCDKAPTGQSEANFISLVSFAVSDRPRGYEEIAQEGSLWSDDALDSDRQGSCH